jgi:hypothetical protein
VNITIRGVITNLAEAKPAIDKDTYLQLLSVSPGGALRGSITVAADGRVTYESDLPKTAIPARGPFSIQCKGLTPGKYLVAAQRGSFAEQPFLRKGTSYLLITVPERVTGPVLDVGAVTLPLTR